MNETAIQSVLPHSITPPKGAFLFHDKLVVLSEEMYADLVREADERGISLAQAYEEELEAQRKLEEVTPPLEEVIAIARRGGAPEYMQGK